MEALNNKSFLTIVGVLFAFVSALHLVRVLFKWDMIIGNFMFPFLWSYYVAFVLFFLSALSFSLAGPFNFFTIGKKKTGLGKRSRTN